MLLALLEDLLSDYSFLLLYNPRDVTTRSVDSMNLFIFGVLCIYYDIILFIIFYFKFLTSIKFCLILSLLSIYAQLLMIRKYVRSPNSEKYNNKMHLGNDCFDMTLAEMDIGVYQPLHTNIVNQFKQLLQAKPTIKQQNRRNRHASNPIIQSKAKQRIIQWYNSQFECSNLKLPQKSDQKQTGSYIDTHVLLCTSIVTFCSYCILALTKQNDNILITTPVYSSYSSIIKSLNRKVTFTKLVYKSEGNAGNFFIDFADVEKKLKEEKVKMILLSHPHNPSGRSWSISEIKLIVSLCRKYNVIIVSDEILSDLYLGLSKNANQFYSFARQFQSYTQIIVLNSISKAFNYSSLQAGYGLTCNQAIYQSLNNAMQNVYGEQVDGLGIAGICGCLTKEGREWLQMIRSIIQSNYIKFINFKQCRAPKLQISLLDAAYILYVDFSSYFHSKRQLQKALSKYKIWVLFLGSNYYPSEQNCLHVRICIACEEKHFNQFLVALDQVIKLGELKAKL